MQSDEEKEKELAEQIDSFGDEKNLVEIETDVELQKNTTLKEINEAKSNAKQRAGLLKTTDSGSILDDDKYQGIQLPKTGAKIYEDMLKCHCTCHDSDKKDCMNCYDHPTHLKESKAVIEKLMEDDKPVPKKRWYQR